LVARFPPFGRDLGEKITDRRLSQDGLHIGYNKLTTFIVDEEFAITVELKDSNKSTDQATGRTTYSNSEATVYLMFLFLKLFGLKQN
jgi:hypothetical protein